MKKYIISAIAIVLALSIFSCGKKEEPDLSELFENPSENGSKDIDTEKGVQTAATDNKNALTEDQNASVAEDTTVSDAKQENAGTETDAQNDAQQSQNQNDTASQENNGSESSDAENGNTGDAASDSNTNEQDADNASAQTPGTEGTNTAETSSGNNGSTSSAAFSHSEEELQNIKSRYIEAEDFYYTMLYQQYDLDSYDTIEKKNSDGYSNEYHRVLYYDVNSLADLKGYYQEYFTGAFISSLDFTSYVEENDKLYCAQTENSQSSVGAKHIYTVESIDENNAYIIRTNADGTGMQKIKAVKSGENWYFGGVAIG